MPGREGETFEPKRVLMTPWGTDVYDFGANIAGWCEIEVEGESGAKVRLDYDESISNRNVLLGDNRHHLLGKGEPRPVHHDEYVLAGREGGEMWHPRFTYHGFRYVQVEFDGKAKLKSIKARFVHSAFEREGTLETSDATFAALQSATERSYLSNFVGIPTDCPHREKNGWTGDAQLAMETGLWNFDAKGSYVHFLRMAVDAQRQNGAVSVREGWSVAGSTTDDAALARLLACVRGYGMEALVETHTAEEIDRAVRVGARVIGVNCRDLRTFRTDPSITAALLGRIPADLVRIAESGIRGADDLKALRAAGADGFLIGETLMRAERPGEALARLREAADSTAIDGDRQQSNRL